VPYTGSGWRLEIYGRDGAIYASTGGMPQMTEVSIMASKGAQAPVDMPVPARLTIVPEDTPKGPPHNVGQLYSRLAPAITEGRDVEPSFQHAVRLHKLIDAMQRASDEGRTVKVN
jgi:predicted dehydrogenase